MKAIHLILMYISKFCNKILFLIDPHKMPQTYQIMFDRIWAMEAINTKIYFHPSNNKVVLIFCVCMDIIIQLASSITHYFQCASCRTILCVYHIIQFQKYSYWCSVINCYTYLYFVYNLCGTQLWYNKFYFKFITVNVKFS